MDIRNWTAGQLLQLPDWCYGERYCVEIAIGTQGGVVYDYAEQPLPDRLILWEIEAWVTGATTTGRAQVGLALGNEVPTNDAEYNQLEPIGGLTADSLFDREGPILHINSPVRINRLKRLVQPQGRRLIARLSPITGIDYGFVRLVISRLPAWIPDIMGLGQESAPS